MLEGYQILIRLMVPAIIIVAVNALFTYIVRGNDKELIENLRKEHVLVHLPKAYIWVGIADIVCFSIFFIGMIAFPNGTEAIWVGVIFGIFILMGLVIVFVSLVWKIHIFRHESYFIYISGFGRVHKIQYADIVYYKDGNNTLIVKTKAKRFFMDNKATNFEYLLAMLTQNKVKKFSKIN